MTPNLVATNLVAVNYKTGFQIKEEQFVESWQQSKHLAVLSQKWKNMEDE